ncbi:MAG: ShlB/FhaC/HecB family hemolysin secretion/activation protein [Candidatus Omnitrophica bacterium]|nr:ShlB/FhaC/HecB family hemolysin secretion/activation protein [Candidatus Omnitrophota bacterium]
MRKYKIFLLVLFISGFLSVSIFSQTPPSSQTMGGVIRQSEQLEKGKKLKQKIDKSPRKLTDGSLGEIIPEEEGEKVLITKITVEGVTLIFQKVVDEIISEFKGRELSLREMQRVADLITDEYRKKGYATSRAYIPAQKINNGVLIIKVVEGKLGAYQIRGNRHFKTSLLEKKIKLKPHDYFDYSSFQESLVRINEHPDRTAKATLVPGKKSGTTDIIIDVEDRLPVHISFEYDNFGSRYIENDNYAIVAEHNNILGFDDKLYFRYQRSESDLSRLHQVRYSIPLDVTLDLGVYYLETEMKMGREFKDVDARGKARITGIFLNKALMTGKELDLRLNFGFDHKRIRNFLLGAPSSRDDARVVKTGFDLDYLDQWGRNLFALELDFGIPKIMGGLNSKDSRASRSGAGGNFNKMVGSFFRLQPAPFDSNILWKNYFQFSSYNLLASEQFQIGGAATVRGYPPAEHAGDKGWHTSVEWSFPIYFIPKKLKVPFSGDHTFYDSLRLVVFYDWATAHANKVLAGEKKHRTLKGTGFGARFNLSEQFSARIELGYPLGKTPSDSNHLHTWVEIICKF